MSDTPEITMQELFNRAYTGLARQGFMQAVAEDGDCLYFDPQTGRRCAWGHCDPGTDLSEYEGVGVDDLATCGRGLAAKLNRSMLNLAGSLQTAHDMGCTPDNMRSRLRKVAENYYLTVPAV